ncbi:MAG: hypothetical protein OXP11_22465 [Gammaproteobacteria bacterium]|nr:hypothetical protein [Gammaproteobacteria bacterium]
MAEVGFDVSSRVLAPEIGSLVGGSVGDSGSASAEWRGRTVSRGGDPSASSPASVTRHHERDGVSGPAERRSYRSRAASSIGSVAKLPILALKAVTAKFRGAAAEAGGANGSSEASAVRAGQASERFAQRLARATTSPDDAVSQKALSSSPTRLANYLANNAGGMPARSVAELGVAVEFAKGLDGDLGKVAELVDKSLSQPLSDGERQELETLVASNKHNIKVATAWVEGQLHQGQEAGSATETVLKALNQNFRESILDLGDIAALSDVEETSDVPVSRSDRANAHLQHAEAALSVARNLSVPGLGEAAKEQLVGELQAHRDQLAQIRDVTDGKSDAPGAELKLVAKSLWEEPLTLVKAQGGSDKDVAALRKQWSGGPGPGDGGSSLPTTHPKVGQARVLREFIQDRLAQAGVAKDQLPDIKTLQRQVHVEVCNSGAWEPVHTRVEASLPNGNGERTVVHSHIVPAKAIAAHFAEGYAGNGITSFDRTQYKHVPNLAQTSVTNQKGETLFSGLRHGILDSYRITGKHLRSLPEAGLKQVIRDTLVNDEAQIDDIAKSVRGSSKKADATAMQIRGAVSQNMAKEMAVAALVSNPAKLEDALHGKTVTLDLASVSLVTPDHLRHTKDSKSSELTMLAHQQQGLAKLQDAGTVKLQVRDAQGEPRTVTAKVNVRQFNFGVNQGAVGRVLGPMGSANSSVVSKLMGWNFAMKVNDPGLTKLVGPANSQGLGGDVAARVQAMRDRAATVEDLLVSVRTAQQEELPENVERSARVAGLENELASLRKNARILTEAGEQIKSLWSTQGYRDGDSDPYKLVSRLALVSHVMGEDTLFNCKSGKDRTGQLDAEVKYLATYADRNDGALPPVGRDMEASRAARSAFALHTGNLEMQRLNAGLPGYKLDSKQVTGLNDLVEGHMMPVYRGGSKFVSS